MKISRLMSIEVGTNLETLCQITKAQQDALRSVFSSSRWRGVRITHGTYGLPDSYIHVLCEDGYEMGIDQDGRVSS